MNTSPACSPLTGGAYVAAIADRLGIPLEEVNFGALDLLSPEQEERDTDDEVVNDDEEGRGESDEARDLVAGEVSEFVQP